MEVGKLTVQLRETTGKGISRRLRRAGHVPGVCYGAGMEAPLAVSLDPKALKASLDPVKKRNTVIDVTVAQESGSPISLKAMLWDYQIDAIRQEVTHVDLKSIDPDSAVEAEVPVNSTGKHPGAIDGGLLSWARHTLHISAKPADIPAELLVDINELYLGDALHVSDVVVPEGVVLLDANKLTIVSCVAPKGAARQADDEEGAEGEEAAAAVPAAEEKK